MTTFKILNGQLVGHVVIAVMQLSSKLASVGQTRARMAVADLREVMATDADLLFKAPKRALKVFPDANAHSGTESGERLLALAQIEKCRRMSPFKAGFRINK